MTRQELQNTWGSLSPNERFQGFQSWILDRLSSVEYLIGPINIQLDGNANPVGGNTNVLLVNPSLFQDADSSQAISVGNWFIVQNLNRAQTIWYDREKERKELEKAAKKQRDKLTEKLLKDSKPKGSKAGYGDYYLNYYLPKLHGEFASP